MFSTIDYKQNWKTLLPETQVRLGLRLGCSYNSQISMVWSYLANLHLPKEYNNISSPVTDMLLMGLSTNIVFNSLFHLNQSILATESTILQL